MKFDRIHIELTNRCNFACEFCPDSIMIRKRGDMEFELLDKILTEIQKTQLTKTILFHVMGEPLLYPRLEMAVKYAKKKGFKVCLTTNGWLMTDKALESLLKNNIDEIIFSVQTPDARSFHLRKSKVDFNKYQEKITSHVAKALNSDASTNIILSFLTTPFKNILLPSKKVSIVDSERDLHKHLILWLKEILNKGKGVEAATKINDNLQQIKRRIEGLSLLGWNRLRITKTLTFETRLLGDWIHPGLYSDKAFKACIGNCEGLTEHFGILWNGDLVFCCVDFDGKTVFGNVKNASIKDAFQKKEVQAVIKGFERLRIMHPYCQKCLGDVSLKKSFFRQLGSVVYFKFYRHWWEKKRSQAKVLVN